MARSTRLTLLVSVLVVAACGGAGGGASSAATSRPSVSAPAATDAGAGSSRAGASGAGASGAASPAAASGGGGGASGDACSLATTVELQGLFGVPALTLMPIAGPPPACIVTTADGRPYASWSVNDQDVDAVFGAMTVGAEAVPGLGDQAAFVENTGLLVRKGGRLLTIVIAAGADVDAEKSKELAKAIGALAAPRL